MIFYASTVPTDFYSVMGGWYLMHAFVGPTKAHLVIFFSSDFLWVMGPFFVH